MKDLGAFFRIVEKTIDLLLNLAAAALGFWVATKIQPPPEGLDPVRTCTVVGALALIALLTYSINNIYRPMRAEKEAFYIRAIISANILTFALGIVYVVLWPKEYTFYLYWLIIAFLFSTFILISKKLVMMAILHRIREGKRNTKRVLLMTDSQELTESYLREIHENPHFGYEVIGYVGNLAIDTLKHLGQTNELDRILGETRPDEVVMAFETVRRKVMTKYVSVCDEHCIKVLVVPAVCGFLKSPKQIKQMGGLPMVDTRATPLDNLGNRFIKRAMDILLSLLLIILFSPVMLVAAIGVRISSPGPILFRQTRIGKGNKPFTIYKFRSMRVNDAEASGWTTDHDSRKTRFGNFIRKYSIDELPQFFNVLKGDMSIVGPRPEIPFFVEQFRKTVPLYMLKHTLRPGITGLAQIHGLRGDTSIELRIEEDIEYIEHWSLWTDIKIILLTPLKAINKHEKAPEETKAETDGEEKPEEKEIGGDNV